MTPHGEWFSEYEKYDVGDVFLAYEPTTKIWDMEGLICC
jgi:hypothetical protein